MKKILIVALVVLASSSFAKKYGMAGCGLGSIVMGSKGNQILAATTNGSFGSQTFGITLGMSNCAEDGVAMNEGETNSFAEANFEALKQEMSQGQGENITVLASLMGCDAQKLGSATRANFGSIFDASDVTAPVMLERVEATGACSEN